MKSHAAIPVATGVVSAELLSMKQKISRIGRKITKEIIFVLDIYGRNAPK